jgi:hypothetical protein
LRDANTDGGDLVLEAAAFVRPSHPDADAVLAPLPTHVERGECADDPFLERRHKAAHVRPAPAQVEHHISHALAGAVVGHLPPAAAVEDGEACLDQLFRLGAGAGSVKRRVFQQPDQLVRAAGGDRRRARLHGRDSLLIGHERVAYPPFGGDHLIRWLQDFDIVAKARHYPEASEMIVDIV